MASVPALTLSTPPLLWLLALSLAPGICSDADSCGHAEVGVTSPSIGGLQVLLEVAVLGEDVIEGLVHDIVGRCVDKCGVLIHQCCRGFVEAG